MTIILIADSGLFLSVIQIKMLWLKSHVVHYAFKEVSYSACIKTT